MKPTPQRPHRFLPLTLPLTLALLTPLGVGAGCITTISGPAGHKPRTVPTGPWVEASPLLAAKIEDHAARLAYLQRLEEFRDEIGWFVQVGEAAYGTLLERVQDEDPKVAGVALAALGDSRDARLVPHLQAIPWPKEERTSLRYERARCHVKLGDWEPMGILVEGLRSEELWARANCFKALRDSTQMDFGYLPKGDPEEREQAVVRWENWLHERSLDPLLDS